MRISIGDILVLATRLLYFLEQELCINIFQDNEPINGQF